MRNKGVDNGSTGAGGLRMKDLIMINSYLSGRVHLTGRETGPENLRSLPNILVLLHICL